MTEIGKRIKYLRRIRGLTQEELGKACGVSNVAIAHYERGDVHQLKRDVIEKMAVALDCSPAYLLNWSNSVNGDISVGTNNGVAGQNNGNVTVIEKMAVALSKEEEELLRIYRELDVRARITLLQTAIEMEEKE